MATREPFERSRARLSLVGALCAGLTVLVQGIEQVLSLAMPAPATRETLIQYRPVDGVLAASGLFRLLLLLTLTAAIALNRARRAPAASLVGFACTLLVIGFELAQRSIDLFVVRLQWAREYDVTQAAAVQAQILERAAQWNRITEALYFPPIVMLCIASGCFALALWSDERRLTRLVALAWTLNAARLSGRLLAYGFHGLRVLVGHIYFPVVVVLYATVAVWLWSESREASRKSP